VDDEIRVLVMRGYETARQIIERQRAAVKALAEELLEFESVDAGRLTAIMAAAVLPAPSVPPAVRDALNEASLN
jgi:ATP-dependent Zn protease